MMIKFTLLGKPIAQPRQRHAVRGGHAVSYMPKDHPIHGFKLAIQNVAYCEIDKLIEGPVCLSLVFVMPRPKGKIWKRKPMPRYLHTSTPDADNLAKAVMDALNGIAYKDDSQVCQLRVEKWVAGGDEMPHIDVEIGEISV